jgi:predicted DCC family thiol-disulfide oxidoreductase YuxK
VPAARDTLFYDDSCGFCRRWVLYWAPTLRRHGIAVAPLQSDAARALDVAEAELYRDVWLRLASGERRRGADVYRYAMRRIWWAYPGFLVSSAPGLRWLFDRAYRKFADNRFHFSSACGLPNQPGHH